MPRRSAQRAAAASARPETIDPTLPVRELTIDDKTYTLSLDLNSLWLGEVALRKRGESAELLMALPNFNVLDSVLVVFACSLQRFHPEVTMEQARELGLAVPAIYEIREAVQEAWILAMRGHKGGSKKKPGPPQRAD